ncbi:hypothetical protein TRFO_13134 [Tritrichomonas foetus]|uniref:Putative nitroreductase TM1586 domain-containing protein n=1 Tax=Tritrichomonas foetus TaxID=1144522 RepID=A0A1J4KZ66_9EUKA|nr:hypothetical protein TRFO_13134 [Tritrichomonas foetus]|eukprot:OHT16543.1 hypothetical protein TRFO_13134 [Tritrichomonas foetus]
MTQENETVSELSLVEAFKARHSCRSFKGTFPEEKKQILAEIVDDVNKLKTPFGSHVEIAIHGPGLGKMGFISNETGWLLQKIPNEIMDDVEKRNKAYTDASYLLQHAVMKMTQNRISTVWIAGTFSAKKAQESTPGFSVPAVVAFGEESTPHLMSKVIKFFSPGKRFPISDLFFDNVNKTAFNDQSSGQNLELFECVRSGPSAVNHQTWRFVVNENSIDLFNGKGDAYSIFDMGIAIANLEMICKEIKGKADIIIKEEAPEPSPLGGTYVATVSFE